MFVLCFFASRTTNLPSIIPEGIVFYFGFTVVQKAEVEAPS
jgi:hypothetical protein